MVDLIVRVIDSLILIIHLVIEDLVWIKDYLQSVTNSECLVFFGIMFVYLYLYKFVMRNLSRILGYIFSGFDADYIEEIRLYELIKNHTVQYCREYAEGYIEGYDKYKKENTWRKWLPWNWF